MNRNAEFEADQASSALQLEPGETHILRSCNPDTYEDGVAFRFILPKDGLALCAVDVKDGVPKLRFAASPKVLTINEEDVAVIVRLCLEDKRPEFFYMGFPFNHPFFDTGRLYKWCRPEYLRHTSVGKLLAEVDWLMKCLHVGVRTSASDKSETIFRPWNERSQLELAIRDDFPEDKPNATVVMSCKSVEVQRGDEELIFDEVKMRIDAVDRKSNLPYSEYITRVFDSVAYYDAPLFLKMKEIVKLVLAIEWLKEKGVKFSKQWVMEHTDKPRQIPLQPIEVKGQKMSEDMIQYIMNQLRLKAHANERQISLPPNSLLTVQTTLEDKTVTETTLQLKVKTTLKFSSSTEDELKIEKTTELTVSVDDYDMLYKGIDPNFPLGIDDSGEFIIPNVNSWSELYFSETVPSPCIWRFSPSGIAAPAVIGGVTTRNIPVKEVPITAAPKTISQVQTRQPKEKAVSNPVAHCMQHEGIAVTASSARRRKKPKSSMIPQPNIVKVPNSDVRVSSREADRNRALSKHGVKTRVGCKDEASSSMSTGSGRPVEQRRSIRVRAENGLRVDGGKLLPGHTSFGMIPLPPALTQTSGNETKLPQRENMELPHLQASAQPSAVDAKGSPTASEESGYSSIETASNHNAVDQPAILTDKDSDLTSTDSGISTPREQLELESRDNSSDNSDEMDT